MLSAPMESVALTGTGQLSLCSGAVAPTGGVEMLRSSRPFSYRFTAPSYYQSWFTFLCVRGSAPDRSWCSTGLCDDGSAVIPSPSSSSMCVVVIPVASSLNIFHSCRIDSCSCYGLLRVKTAVTETARLGLVQPSGVRTCLPVLTP